MNKLLLILALVAGCSRQEARVRAACEKAAELCAGEGATPINIEQCEEAATSDRKRLGDERFLNGLDCMANAKSCGAVVDCVIEADPAE